MSLTRQPATGTGINWSNPLARGLRIAVVPTLGLQELVSRKTANIVGSGLTKTPTSKGVAWVPSNQAAGGVEFSSFSPITTGDKSVFVIAAPIAETTQRCAIECRNNTGSGSWGLRFNSNHNGVGMSGDITFYEYNSAWVWYAELDNIVDGTLASYGATRSVNAGALYINGVAQSATVAGTGSMATSGTLNTAVGHLANYAADATYTHTKPIILALAWNRALSAREHAELAINPWQVFAPPTARIYAFPAQTFNPAWNIAANTVIQPGALQA